MFVGGWTTGEWCTGGNGSWGKGARKGMLHMGDVVCGEWCTEVNVA